MQIEIAATEPTANESIIKLGVLLHDIEDAKYKPMNQSDPQRNS